MPRLRDDAGPVERTRRPAVLAKPPDGGFGLLAWLIPLAAGLTGVVVVAVLVRGWSRRRPRTDETASDEPLDAGLERRVDEELARFDG